MKRPVLTLGLIVLAALVAACGGSSASPSTSAPAAAAGSGEAITVVAKDIAFSPTAITAPAGKAFTLILDNQESAPHNIAISDASGAVVFKGEIVTQKQISYSVNARRIRSIASARSRP